MRPQGTIRMVLYPIDAMADGWLPDHLVSAGSRRGSTKREGWQ